MMGATSSYLSAAVQVLRDAAKPLTAAEITDEALRRGLISPAGKTPRSTMSAQLYVAVRDNPDVPVQRLFEPGTGRARRDSVRWAVRDQPESGARVRRH